MHLLLTRQVIRENPERGLVRVPDVPDGIEWGQASSLWRGRGTQAIWVRGDNAVADRVIRRGAEYVARVAASESEINRAFDALRTERAPVFGQPHAALDDVVRAYREVIAIEERILIDKSARMLVTLSSDGCSGSDGTNLNGRNLDNAAGGSATNSWTVDQGTAEIRSAQGQWTSAGQGKARVGSMADTDDMDVSLKPCASGKSTGPSVRASDASNYYLGDINGSDAKQTLWIVVADGFTALTTSTGTWVYSSDVWMTRIAGTTLSGLKNGSVVKGPVTDATIATGKAGMRVFGTAFFDDYLVAGGAPPATARPILVGGKLIGRGLLGRGLVAC